MELPKDLKLIVFDFDGTLHDIVLDWSLAKKLAEAHEGESIAQAVERHKQAGNHKPIQDLELLETEALADQVLAPQIAETLKRLGQNYKQAILTRNSSKPIKALMERSGLDLEVIVGREEVNHFKPHPEGLQLILHKLGIEPHQALMVGDTWHDVEVAHAAGTKCAIVGVNFDKTESGLLPDYKIKSVNELIGL